MQCLFCESGGPFTEEHIIPASLGNNDLVLTDQVCKQCNNYFGSKVEAPILNKSPLAFWRTFLGIRTKRGELPSVDLSQPHCQSGKLASVHPSHDNGIGFMAHEDGSTSMDIVNRDILRRLQDEKAVVCNYVFTPKSVFDLGRFLCKVGIELLCYSDAAKARKPSFQRARRFARYGTPQELWPIFHFSEGTMADLRRRNHGFEEVDCYRYQLLDFSSKYILFCFAMGTDSWLVCLNEPYPTPEIQLAFPGRSLNPIWYTPDQTLTK